MKQAMVFAAGLGTRLKPLTDTMPKALVPVAGRPLLEHVVLRLKANGFERIVVNVHHFGEQIIDFLEANNHFGLDIRISDERAELLETGGGIKKARPLFDPNSPVLIHNVDILSNARLDDLYAVPSAQAALLVSPRQTTRYLQFNDACRLIGWENIKTGELRGQKGAQALAFSGIHLFRPSLFPLMDSWPDRFSIIDFYLSECAAGTIRGVVAPNLHLIDIGSPEKLEEAQRWGRSIFRVDTFPAEIATQ